MKTMIAKMSRAMARALSLGRVGKLPSGRMVVIYYGRAYIEKKPK